LLTLRVEAQAQGAPFDVGATFLLRVIASGSTSPDNPDAVEADQAPMLARVPDLWGDIGHIEGQRWAPLWVLHRRGRSSTPRDQEEVTVLLPRVLAPNLARAARWTAQAWRGLEDDHKLAGARARVGLAHLDVRPLRPDLALWITDPGYGREQGLPTWAWRGGAWVEGRIAAIRGRGNVLGNPCVPRGGGLVVGDEEALHRLGVDRFAVELKHVLRVGRPAAYKGKRVRSYFVREAPDGAFWHAMSGGVTRVSGGRSGDFMTKKEGLPHAELLDLAFDAGGRAWAASHAGLAVQRDDGRWEDRTTGLAHKWCQQLKFDGAGNLWVSHPKALSRVAPDGSVQTFGRRQKVDQHQSIAVTAEGGVWMLDGGRWLDVERAGLRYLAPGASEAVAVPVGFAGEMRGLALDPDGQSLWLIRGLSQLVRLRHGEEPRLYAWTSLPPLGERAVLGFAGLGFDRSGALWVWGTFVAHIPREALDEAEAAPRMSEGLAPHKERLVFAWPDKPKPAPPLGPVMSEAQRRARFPLCDEPGHEARELDPEMMREVAESARPLTPAAWKKALEAHELFLSAHGGHIYGFSTFYAHGLVMAVSRAPKGKGKQGKQLDLQRKRLDPKLSTQGARLDQACLTSCLGEGVDLRGASLAGACMTDSFFAGARFDGANLEGADLSRADLRGASFRGADLRGADFEHAILDGADFTGARLEGSRFPGAKLDLVCAES
jgi:sugar lactone lactonase YvrE